MWLINLLFGRLLGDARGALAAGIYALHPLLSEQVAFISARNDSMAIALGLAAIWKVGSRRPSRGQCIAATLFATAACLSKETGLVVLGLLPLIDWAKGRDAVGWHRYAAVATGVTTAFFVREVIGPGLTHSPPMNAAELVQDERLPLLGHMLGKLTWPWPLTDSTHLAYLGAVDPSGSINPHPDGTSGHDGSTLGPSGGALRSGESAARDAGDCESLLDCGPVPWPCRPRPRHRHRGDGTLLQTSPLGTARDGAFGLAYQSACGRLEDGSVLAKSAHAAAPTPSPPPGWATNSGASAKWTRRCHTLRLQRRATRPPVTLRENGFGSRDKPMG